MLISHENFNLENRIDNGNGYIDYEFSDNSVKSAKRLFILSEFIHENEPTEYYASMMRSEHDDSDFMTHFQLPIGFVLSMVKAAKISIRNDTIIHGISKITLAKP